MEIAHGILNGQEALFEEKVQTLMTQANDFPHVRASVVRAPKPFIAIYHEIVEDSND